MNPLRAGRVEVAAGDGLLARRADAVVFVAQPGGAASWPATLQHFLDAADADAALTVVLDHAVDQRLEVGPFAAVSWSTAAHLVVFGDLTLVSDLASVPRLSGAGMPTWVEHRATRVGERAEVRLGDQPVAGTDLAAGIVPAGGFRVTLLSPSVQPTRMPSIEMPPLVVPPPASPSSWDVLRDAGGAWMDDSLQLSEPRLARPPVVAAPAPEPLPTPTVDESFDPEVTLDAGVLAAAASPAEPDEPGPLTRFVQARRCDQGHLNPPLRTRCRVCEHYLPPSTPVDTVPQPALATLVLGDGRAVDVAGPVVLGRTPSGDAARLDEPGTLVTVGDATVSRTHVVVTVDGWTLLAIDCGTTGGTAVAPPGGEPALLEPWMPHELAPGDTLFLGGPTKIQVVARHE